MVKLSKSRVAVSTATVHAIGVDPINDTSVKLLDDSVATTIVDAGTQEATDAISEEPAPASGTDRSSSTVDVLTPFQIHQRCELIG